MVKRLPDVCTVRLENDLKSSEDFVVVLADDDGKVELLYNTDALTIGVAIKLLTSAFVDIMNSCTLEERNEITGILGEAFSLEAIQCET